MIATDAPPPPAADESPGAALARMIQPLPGETVEAALDRIARVMVDAEPPAETIARVLAPLPGEDVEATYQRLTRSGELIRIRGVALLFGVQEVTAYEWNETRHGREARYLPEPTKLPQLFNPQGFPIWTLADLLRWGEQVGRLLWVYRADGELRVRTGPGQSEAYADLAARYGANRVGTLPDDTDRGFVPVRITRLMYPGPARRAE